MFDRVNPHFASAVIFDGPCSIEQGQYIISNGLTINGETHWKMVHRTSNTEEVRYIPEVAVRHFLPVCEDLAEFWFQWINGFIIDHINGVA